jgi:hypothetical protein
MTLDRWGGRRARAVLVSILVSLAGCQADRDTPDRDACVAVLDHVVDLEVARRDGAPRARPDVLERHRDVLRAAIADRVLGDCMARPTTHAACVQRARTATDLIACK